MVHKTHIYLSRLWRFYFLLGLPKTNLMNWIIINHVYNNKKGENRNRRMKQFIPLSWFFWWWWEKNGNGLVSDFSMILWVSFYLFFGSDGWTSVSCSSSCCLTWLNCWEQLLFWKVWLVRMEMECAAVVCRGWWYVEDLELHRWLHIFITRSPI